MPITDEQFHAYANRVEKMADDIDKLVHGNGRTGFHQMLDDIYGPKDRHRPGLINRVAVLEVEVREIRSRANENRWMQRGIAIGITLVTLDVFTGGDLSAVVRALFGGV